MAFKPNRQPGPPDLDKLKSSLAETQLQTKNNALWQVVKGLIDGVQQGATYNKTEFNKLVEQINSINNSINIIIGTLIQNSNFITWSDETLNLPNSRNLLAGSNVSFDDAVAGERTINVTSGGSLTDYVVASDGALPTPSPMDDGFGNFMYIPYTP